MVTQLRLLRMKIDLPPSVMKYTPRETYIFDQKTLLAGEGAVTWR